MKKQLLTTTALAGLAAFVASPALAFDENNWTWNKTVDEVVNSDQLAARDYWRTLAHPELGQSFRYPGPFASFSATPLAYRRRPPRIGEHNDDIYRGELGLSADEIAALQSRGII